MITAAIGLWVLYVIVMKVWHYSNTLEGWKRKAVLALLVPLAAGGWVIDVLFNFTFGSVLFVQWPDWRNPTLSQRLQEIIAEYQAEAWVATTPATKLEKYRYYLAVMICEKLLHPYDKNHCGVIHDVP